MVGGGGVFWFISGTLKSMPTFIHFKARENTGGGDSERERLDQSFLLFLLPSLSQSLLPLPSSVTPPSVPLGNAT